MVAAGAAGKALYDIGEQFDSAYDTIRTGTGATGKELEGLKNDFRDVVKSVPTDFDSAAKAITQVNQRLGITGEPLRHLSKQFLELSRITGTDLDSNIQEVTRTMGDWGIKVKQQPAFLDKMFRASQATGISVGDLGAQMVRYGAPLRQMGFGFSEAAAMVGKFEKEGVNAQLVMGSLRIALGKMATEGVEDPSKALELLTQRIKDAGSAGEANKLAIETFGARAGPDMAAAIREGRFEYDDLVKSIDGGKETIIGAGQDTMDFGERWQMLKNRIFVALEPAATAVFNAIGDGMLQLSNLMAGKGNISEKFRNTVADIRSAITPLILVFQNVLLPAVRMAFEGIKQYFKGAFQIIGGIVKVFAALFRGDWSAMWDGIKQIAQGVLNLLVGMLRVATAPIRSAAQAIANAISGPFDVVKNLASSVGNWLGNVATKIASFVTGFSNKAHDLGSAIFTGILSVVKDAPGAVANWIGDIPGRIANFIGAAASKAFGLGKGVFNGIKDGLASVASSVIQVIKSPINALIDALNALTFKIEIHVDPPGPGSVNISETVDPIPGNIGHLASGTASWGGGFAIVGEEGPELAWLPRGMAVEDAERTRALLGTTGRRRTAPTEGERVQNIVNNYIQTHGSGMPDPGLLILQLDSRLRALAVG